MIYLAGLIFPAIAINATPSNTKNVKLIMPRYLTAKLKKGVTHDPLLRKINKLWRGGWVAPVKRCLSKKLGNS